MLLHYSMPAMGLESADGCSRAGDGNNVINAPPTTAQRHGNNVVNTPPTKAQHYGNETINCSKRNKTTSQTEAGGDGDSQNNNTTLPLGGSKEEEDQGGADQEGDDIHEEEMDDSEDNTDFPHVNCEDASDQRHLCSSDEKARQLCQTACVQAQDTLAYSLNSPFLYLPLFLPPKPFSSTPPPSLTHMHTLFNHRPSILHGNFKIIT